MESFFVSNFTKAAGAFKANLELTLSQFVGILGEYGGVDGIA